MTSYAGQIVKLLVFLAIFGTVAEGKVFGADTVIIDNSVQSSSQTGGRTSFGEVGQPGQDGADGKSGAAGLDGTDGSRVQSKSSASVEIKSTIDGETVEYIYKTTEGESIVSASSAVEINAVEASNGTEEDEALVETNLNQSPFLQTLETFRIILMTYVALLF